MSLELPLVLIFLGPPGAGKGTHALPLSKQLQIPHISTGALFREHIGAETPLGLQAKEYIHRGHLVPDELVLAMFFERVAEPDCAQGYILDGFPRTLSQAKKLRDHLADCRSIALYIDVPDEVLIERITGRLVCKGCTHCYHKIYDPPEREGTCDSCGNVLYTRKDDQEEVFHKRLEVYRTETSPLIHFYKDVLVTINGKRPKEQVFQEILAMIPSPVLK